MSAAVSTTAPPTPTKVPALALGAALMLWGACTGAWLFAAVMAAALEAARLTSWRWELSDKDFERLADATGLGFVVVVIYVFDTYSFQGIYILLQWLPFILFPLAAAQRYSTRDSVRYAALFLSVRRAERKGALGDAGAVDFDLPFIVACLVSATAGELGGAWLFAGLAGVLAYLLWANRPRRASAGLWFVTLLLVIGLGYAGQLGVLKARRLVEPLVMDFIRDRVMGYRSPYRSYTALGHIGRLKRSDRIVLRVKDLDGAGVPALLHEAAYQTFSKNVWLAGHSAFEEQTSDIEGTTWALEEAPAGALRSLRVSRPLVRGRGLLAVPSGTVRIEELPVEELHRNKLGALKVNRGPGLVQYTARYLPGGDFALPPTVEDMRVPQELEPLMTRVLDQSDLRADDPYAAIRKLLGYFVADFEYSVQLRNPGPIAKPLHEFLLNSRSGHCEFFASATVLLLRVQGIPARYATGYSVQEYSPLEQSYVVRRRHAHSWATAYVGGRWVDVDTTPPSWGDLEDASAPWWESGYDVLSWLMFQFSSWRWSRGEEGPNTDLLWLLVPLVLILSWRFARTERVSKRRRKAKTVVYQGKRPGDDSELYALIAALEKRGFVRDPGQPLGEWLDRLCVRNEVSGVDTIVTEMLPVHYRYRFDPEGISAADRKALQQRVRAWLDHYASLVVQ